MRIFEFILLISFFSLSSTLPVSSTTSVSLIDVEEEEYDSSSTENLLDHPWSCGTDGLSMLIAEGTIDKDCPPIKSNT